MTLTTEIKFLLAVLIQNYKLDEIIIDREQFLNMDSLASRLKHGILTDQNTQSQTLRFYLEKE